MHVGLRAAAHCDSRCTRGRVSCSQASAYCRCCRGTIHASSYHALPGSTAHEHSSASERAHVCIICTGGSEWDAMTDLVSPMRVGRGGCHPQRITAATAGATVRVSELSTTRDAPLLRSSARAVSPCHLHSSMRREQQSECAAAVTPSNGRDFCSLWLTSKQKHSNDHKHRHESTFNTEYNGD